MRSHHRQRGIALVLVLWMMVLLMVIAASLTVVQRNEIGMVSAMVQERQARAAISAAQQVMIYRLLNPPASAADQEPEWKADGVLRPWQFEGFELRIAATPESGRIDLNQAAPEMLEQLFIEVGLDPAEAEALRDTILDWIDPDDDARLHGAEKSDYQAAGLPYGPRNRRFETLQELRQVLGMTPEVYRAVAPALTIHSGQRTVNPLFADRLVLYAIPEVDRGVVDRYLIERDEALAQGLEPSMPPFGGNFVSPSGARVYRLYAEVELDQGRMVRGEMLISLGGGGGGGRPSLHFDRAPGARAYQVLENHITPQVRPIDVL